MTEGGFEAILSEIASSRTVVRFPGPADTSAFAWFGCDVEHDTAVLCDDDGSCVLSSLPVTCVRVLSENDSALTQALFLEVVLRCDLLSSLRLLASAIGDAPSLLEGVGEDVLEHVLRTIEDPKVRDLSLVCKTFHRICHPVLVGRSLPA